MDILFALWMFPALLLLLFLGFPVAFSLMSVALLLHKNQELDQLLGWAALIARARQEDLLVLQPVKAAGESKVVELKPTPASSESALAVAILLTIACFVPTISSQSSKVRSPRLATRRAEKTLLYAT